jgi:hypothetical protein
VLVLLALLASSTAVNDVEIAAGATTECAGHSCDVAGGLVDTFPFHRVRVLVFGVVIRDLVDSVRKRVLQITLSACYTALAGLCRWVVGKVFTLSLIFLATHVHSLPILEGKLAFLVIAINRSNQLSAFFLAAKLLYLWGFQACLVNSALPELQLFV